MFQEDEKINLHFARSISKSPQPTCFVNSLNDTPIDYSYERASTTLTPQASLTSEKSLVLK